MGTTSKLKTSATTYHCPRAFQYLGYLLELQLWESTESFSFVNTVYFSILCMDSHLFIDSEQKNLRGPTRLVYFRQKPAEKKKPASGKGSWKASINRCELWLFLKDGPIFKDNKQ